MFLRGTRTSQRSSEAQRNDMHVLGVWGPKQLQNSELNTNRLEEDQRKEGEIN
jgi:hypothetical protein